MIVNAVETTVWSQSASYSMFKNDNGGVALLQSELKEWGVTIDSSWKLNELKRQLKGVVGNNREFVAKSDQVCEFYTKFNDK